PLPFAGLASQKNHMSLYLMCLYLAGEHLKWFKQAWSKSGKKLDMGKSCVRFKKLEDLALDVIGEAIERVPASKYIACFESATQSMKKQPPGERIDTRKPPKKTTAAKSAKRARKKS